MLSIAVDGCVFENTHQRGIQRYFYELCLRVARTDRVVVGIDHPAQSPIPDGCRISGPVFPRPVRRWNLIGKYASSRRSRLKERKFSGCSVFHSTYFTLGPQNVPAVVTVHDMIPEQFPEWCWDMQGVVEQKQLSLVQAKKIIAVSQATADELLAFYPWCGDRVTVVHHGADHLMSGSGREPSAGLAGGGYVLFVGDRVRYKNLRVVLEAMKQPDWPAQLPLRIVGPDLNPGEKLLIQRLGLENRVQHIGRVTDSELGDLYGRATAFLFPSLAEGFGFPLLEAQRCGCPVICSDIPVFHEVAHESALFADALDPHSWVGHVQSLMDLSRREKMIAAGFQNEKRFRWDQCAKQTLDLYLSAAAPDGSDRERRSKDRPGQ